jgi:hypothetical protein
MVVRKVKWRCAVWLDMKLPIPSVFQATLVAVGIFFSSQFAASAQDTNGSPVAATNVYVTNVYQTNVYVTNVEVTNVLVEITFPSTNTSYYIVQSSPSLSTVFTNTFALLGVDGNLQFETEVYANGAMFFHVEQFPTRATAFRIGGSCKLG